MEQIKINDRLLTAVPFVREGKRLADIGTDHAYLPIYLLSKGKIAYAIAADINKGPLDKASENVIKYGFEKQVKLVLCDGLSRVLPDEIDDIAIFGMGGELIVKIIDEAAWLKNAQKRLILQPMTHPEKLRQYLFENGYSIVGETLSLDRGKIYQTICAEYDGINRDCDNFSLIYGKHILEESGNLLEQMMIADKKKLLRKIEGKKAGNEDISYEENLLRNIEKYIER